MRRVWPVNLLLLAGIVFFAWRSWTFPGPGGATPGRDGGEVEMAREPAPDVPPLPEPPPREQYGVVTERNLFSPSRSPAPPPPAPAAEARPPVPVENPQDRYVVYGVVRLEGGKSLAILKDKKTPNAKPRSYGVGDVLTGGYAIRTIDQTRVVVASGGRETDLRLRAPKGAEDTGFVPRPVPPVPQPALTRPPIVRGTPQQVQRPGVRQPGVRQTGARRTTVRRPPIDDDDEDFDDEDFDDEDFDDEDFDDEDFDDEDFDDEDFDDEDY